MTQERPSDRLRELAAVGASGEFICVTASFEVHVFLQAGRVAWATDSKHPFAFASTLQRTARIDVDTFRQLVEECRRDRLPLGETMVEWGLASWEQVRAALSNQIRQAISLIAALPSAHTLFLEREYAEYNERLTFAPEEFLGEPESQETAAREPELPAEQAQPAGLAQQLRSSIDGLAWVEVLEGGSAIDSDPATRGSRVPEALLGATLGDGADFVAIRSSQGSVVGLRLPRSERSLWCRLEADSTFGAVLAALWSMTSAADRAMVSAPTRRGAVAWSLGDETSARAAEIVSFLLRAEELLGVLLLPELGAGGPVFACGSSDVEAEYCLDVAGRRAPTLTRFRIPDDCPGGERLCSIGFYLRTIVTGETRFWCFGAELDPRSGETLWIFTDRRSSQGLGWAYLTALARALSRFEPESNR